MIDESFFADTLEGRLGYAEMRFGWRMNDLRLAKDMSQEELADRIGVSAATVSRYENGLTFPTIHTLIRLREALETTLDYLVAGIRPPEAAPRRPS